jgi:hypothetical protein
MICDEMHRAAFEVHAEPQSAIRAPPGRPALPLRLARR